MTLKMFLAGTGLLVLCCLTQNASAGFLTNLAAKKGCDVINNEEILLEGYLRTGEAARDIERAGCDSEAGAYLYGAEEGFKGERFSFYLGSADPAKKRELLKHYYACSEFGVPVEKDGGFAKFDSVVKENVLKEFFMKPVESFLKEFYKSVVNWFSYTWDKLTGDTKTVKYLKGELDKARKEAAAQLKKDELKTIPAEDAKKEPKEAKSAQAYACCMRGFMATSGAMSQLIRETENNDCKNSFAVRCKKYFRAGAGKAQLMCNPETPDTCAKCGIEDILAEVEPDRGAQKGLAGCAASGLMDKLQELKSGGFCEKDRGTEVKTADKVTKSGKNNGTGGGTTQGNGSVPKANSAKGGT